jgi:transposase
VYYNARMAMESRGDHQATLGVVTSEMPKSPGHSFYARLNALLDAHEFDWFVEDLCACFYAPVMGRPSLPPARYFRLLLVGYFEGLESERGIAWRATDSLGGPQFSTARVGRGAP